MEEQNEETLHQVFWQVMRLHFSRTHSLLEKTGVYPGQPPLLFSLYKQNGQSQKELATHLNVKAATMTVMIKRMEKNGLIERKQDENDQRISRIYISEKGLKICKELHLINKQIEKECFEGFTMEEKLLMRRLLVQIRDNLKSASTEEKDCCFHQLINKKR